MFVSHIDKIEGIKLKGDNLKDAVKKVLIGPKEGWEDHVMRLFSLKEGGYTPKHSHPWIHVNIILEGKGTLFLEGKEYEVERGSVALVPENALHQYRADRGEKLEFICIVPLKGESGYQLK
ncbi:conserved hypothetical protein [Thermotomaculum hydrothermale]|uniref:Cupin type-2 domain-containing protein n=1 Tax=Thermotomaculum hydrothermale TaxID=981385 RepID=A0A7R6PVE8_9BACT|nr:cupin domain-containing protein [Thermotomaculum hydrothermale]BBB33372.1 conserved hypothetical protein [Thermotomaculum hydrothermale]